PGPRAGGGGGVIALPDFPRPPSPPLPAGSGPPRSEHPFARQRVLPGLPQSSRPLVLTRPMQTYLPGTEVEARGLRWEVVSADLAGSQVLYRLRGVGGAFQGREL